MNSRQAAQYQRGLEIAQRDALTVVAHGTRKSDGAAIYCVPSRSKPGQWHIIVVTGLDLTCTCEAGQHGKYCCHRAAVRARLILEGQVRQDAQEREVERLLHAAARELEARIDATIAGDALLQSVMDKSDYADLTARAAHSRSPKLADDQRVFSVFK
jgi:SWIM zinc finger